MMYPVSDLSQSYPGRHEACVFSRIGAWGGGFETEVLPGNVLILMYAFDDDVSGLLEYASSSERAKQRKIVSREAAVLYKKTSEAVPISESDRR